MRAISSSLILLLSFVTHFSHAAPFSSLVSLQTDSNSLYDVDHYDSAYPFSDFDSTHDLDLEPPDPLSDVACPPQGPCRLSSSDLAIRSPGEVTLHRRGKAKKQPKQAKSTSRKHEVTNEVGAPLNKAGNVIGKVGSVLSKVANAIPGPIGTVLKVVAYFLEALGRIFKAVAEAEKESAQKRGNFTQQVVAETYEEHKGWMIVTVYSKWKPQYYFPGKEGVDWKIESTEVHTGLGKYHYHVYIARYGMLYLNGDGGFLNWAWKALANLLQPLSKGLRKNSDPEKIQSKVVVVHPNYPNGIHPDKAPPSRGRCTLHVNVFENGGPNGELFICAGLVDNDSKAIGYGASVLSKTDVFKLDSQLLPTDQITIREIQKVKRHHHPGHALDIRKGLTPLKCTLGGEDGGETQMDCHFSCPAFQKVKNK